MITTLYFVLAVTLLVMPFATILKWGSQSAAVTFYWYFFAGYHVFVIIQVGMLESFFFSTFWLPVH